jgi:cytoskeletal protein RodZ
MWELERRVLSLSELGGALQRARQEKGMTLYDVQEATKIQIRYLEAIESGHFDVLPGLFYVRAFIKSYAETVGLDADALIAEHSSELPAPPVVEDSPTPLRQNRQPRKEGNGGGKWVSRIMLYLFAILIAVVLYFAFNYSYKGKQAEPAQPIAKSPTVSSPTGEIVVPPPAKPKPAPGPAPAPKPTQGTLTPVTDSTSIMNYQLAGADKITVSVKANTGAHWMSVSDENGQITQATVDEGKSNSWEIKGKVAKLRIYRVKDVTVTVNGQAIDTSAPKRRGTQEIIITRQ